MTDTPEADTAPEPTAPEPTATADEVAKWKALARKHEAEVKQLRPQAAKAKELEDAQLTELEKTAERAAQAEARAAALELQVTRERVAREKGLTDFAEFLTGTTEEEIAAQADRLAERLPGRAPGRPVEQLHSATTAAPAVESSMDDWIRASAHGRR